MRTSDEKNYFPLFRRLTPISFIFFRFLCFCFFYEKLKMSTIYVAMQKRIPPITRSKRNDKMTANKNYCENRTHQSSKNKREKKVSISNVRVQYKGEFHRKVLISCALCELMPVVMMISWACCFFSFEFKRARWGKHENTYTLTPTHTLALYSGAHSHTHARTQARHKKNLHAPCTQSFICCVWDFAIYTQEPIQWQWKIPNCYKFLAIRPFRFATFRSLVRAIRFAVVSVCTTHTRRNRNEKQ